MALQVVEDVTASMKCETKGCGYADRPADHVRLGNALTYEDARVDAREHVRETGHQTLLLLGVLVAVAPLEGCDCEPCAAARNDDDRAWDYDGILAPTLWGVDPVLERVPPGVHVYIGDAPPPQQE